MDVHISPRTSPFRASTFPASTFPVAAFLAVAVLAAGLAAAVPRPAAAQEVSRSQEASDAIDDELDRLGFDRRRIRGVDLIAQYRPGARGEREIRNFSGRVTFTDCRGDMIIGLNERDAVENVATSGDCRMPNAE